MASDAGEKQGDVTRGDAVVRGSWLPVVTEEPHVEGDGSERV